MRKGKINTLEDCLEYYEELQQRAYDRYQETGEPRHSLDEYIDGLVCRGLRMAIDKNDAVAEARGRRGDNIEEYIKKYLVKNMYTRDEVVELLREIAWW